MKEGIRKGSDDSSLHKKTATVFDKGRIPISDKDGLFQNLEKRRDDNFSLKGKILDKTFSRENFSLPEILAIDTQHGDYKDGKKGSNRTSNESNQQGLEPATDAGSGGKKPPPSGKSLASAESPDPYSHSDRSVLARISNQLFDKTQELCRELTQKEYLEGGYIFSKTYIANAVRDLAETAFLQGDRDAVRLWGQRIDTLKEICPEHVATVYFNASRLGDEIASQRLGELLQKEKEEHTKRQTEATAQSGDFKYVSPMLEAIVEACAKAGILADKWLTYAIDTNDRDRLKLIYCSNTSPTNNDAEIISTMYKNEVTEHFLRGEVLTNNFDLEIAAAVYQVQDKKEKRVEVFQRFQKLYNALRLNEDLHDDELYTDISLHDDRYALLVQFSRALLEKPEYVDTTEAKWIGEMLKINRKNLIAYGYDAKKLSESTKEEIAWEFYTGSSPKEIVDTINDYTLEQFGLYKQEFGTIFISSFHDECLRKGAEYYSKLGDFKSAQIFLIEIADAGMRTYTTAECLKNAKKREDIETIRPDEMGLLFNRALHEAFKTKEAILADDFTAVKELARKYSRQLNEEKQMLTRRLLTQCLTTIYAHDSAQGHELTTEIVQTLPDYLDPRNFMFIAKQQIANGDWSGLQLLYESIGRLTDPVQQCKEYAACAKLVADQLKQV